MRQNNIFVPKIITTLHGTDITLLAKDPSLFEIIKYSIERSSGVTAVSQDLKNDTIKVLKTDKHIEVIHNFYTPPNPSKTKQKIRKQLGIKDSDFLAIHLSNLREVKRIPDLLKIVAGQKNNLKFKLLILSGGDFSPYKPLVKKLGIQHKVIVKDRVTDIENYINAADVGIYTSQTESFGMGMLETMSYGLPVLATKAGGIPEVVDDGKTGFLMKVGDIKAFTTKLNWLIKNPEQAKQMGELAKRIACERFCSKVIVAKYLKYYCEII